MNYSPLRYPGGKSKIAPFISALIDKIGIEQCTYIEPFAGGAGVALALLLENKVNKIVINDYDKAIYSFWRAVINDTNRLIEKIESTPITVEEWYKQKQIYLDMNSKYSIDLAFATFYLNRTNRSGILKAGPIGGKKQNGDYSIDARFNKSALIKRIEIISQRKKDIKVYNKDIISFIKQIAPKYEKNSFIYFDPPYYNKGHELYKNFFQKSDHERIAQAITNDIKSNWIVTYDDTPEIIDIYKKYEIKRFDLNYSVTSNKKSSELMIFKHDMLLLTNEVLDEPSLKINLR